MPKLGIYAIYTGQEACCLSPHRFKDALSTLTSRVAHSIPHRPSSRPKIFGEAHPGFVSLNVDGPVMKVAVFSSKDYDRAYFTKANDELQELK